MSDRFAFEQRPILGIGVHAATMGQALDAIDDAIKAKRRLMVGVVNAAKMINMHKDPELFEDVTGSDLVLADGMSVVHASRILGTPLPERVTGIDLMTGILERGSREGYRVYCLGAKEEISATVAERFRESYPGVNIVGRRNGYFSDDEEEEIAREIGSLDVDVLFVAITSPKKERFMARWAEHLNTTVVHGVGGSFDVVAGFVERAPESWQRLGLEWLYRVKQEPGRLWKRYLVTNAAFLRMVLSAWFKGLFGRKAA
ncbi:MAG: WecB/TagA/CpsF family glycosyltransferase [Gammaproteobacteria bacterium]|nr:WecB/TagA/CpsF family glycosyltransferase [Gammaproteobacteria bacterium]MBT8104809.1 WecB/TagA/CpsF family glycosyltransferase [Gammaproteobacteria bacterium]NNK24823.1 WecB/TagA/CpsF family glycosyltransferase [Woeseiaceae bacterium]